MITRGESSKGTVVLFTWIPLAILPAFVILDTVLDPIKANSVRHRDLLFASGNMYESDSDLAHRFRPLKKLELS